MPASVDQPFARAPTPRTARRCGPLPPRRNARPAARSPDGCDRRGPCPASPPPPAGKPSRPAAPVPTGPLRPSRSTSSRTRVRSVRASRAARPRSAPAAAAGRSYRPRRAATPPSARARPGSATSTAPPRPPVPAPAPIPYPCRRGNGPWSPGYGAASFPRLPPERRGTFQKGERLEHGEVAFPAAARTSPGRSGRGTRSCRTAFSAPPPSAPAGYRVSLPRLRRVRRQSRRGSSSCLPSGPAR